MLIPQDEPHKPAPERPMTAQEADSRLRLIARGDLTACPVSETIPFFAVYLATLGQRAASLAVRPGPCLSVDEVYGFTHKEFDYPSMVRIARHLGCCPDCYEYFMQVEEAE